jgi:xylan 1,4-beta-xylosidase
MLGIISGQIVSVQSTDGLSAADIIASGVRGKNDIHAIASKGENSISIMVWNYHDDNVVGASSEVDLVVNSIGNSKVLVHHYRVDDQFSNSFEKWKTMGKPQDVTTEQYKELERAGQLQLYTSPEWKEADNVKTLLKFDLPRQGVSLIQLTW